MIGEVESFFTQYPHARAVLPPVYALQTDDFRVNSLNVADGRGVVNSDVKDLYQLADYVETLRRNRLFDGVVWNSVTISETYADTDEPAEPIDGEEEEEPGRGIYNMTLTLREGAGVR
jgi:hypothetical protein